MEIRKIRQLARMLKEEHIEEIEIQEGDSYLRLKTTRKATVAEVVAVNGPDKEVETPHRPVKESTPVSGSKIIASPLAGMFYRSKAPGQPPFVSVGDRVKKGRSLCILEAMKLMNELEAEQDCEILEILVEDALSVYEGQALFRILPL
ncbi:acetyl-CoA carboxylase biotin carboxyl carrier protein [bacterium]|nr:acetyl-CoA carboxylase biotin carboxyl carrier protein [candidate division CSSED10-310 bacterium]